MSQWAHSPAHPTLCDRLQTKQTRQGLCLQYCDSTRTRCDLVLWISGFACSMTPFPPPIHSCSQGPTKQIRRLHGFTPSPPQDQPPQMGKWAWLPPLLRLWPLLVPGCLPTLTPSTPLQILFTKFLSLSAFLPEKEKTLRLLNPSQLLVLQGQASPKCLLLRVSAMTALGR